MSFLQNYFDWQRGMAVVETAFRIKYPRKTFYAVRYIDTHKFTFEVIPYGSKWTVIRPDWLAKELDEP